VFFSPLLHPPISDSFTFSDQNFIRTFLCTFKSFSTVNEIFDLLVARFNTPTPAGLTDEEEKDWKKSKQDPLQVRVINIMKQLILDDELLDPEEKGTAVLSIKEFALSVQEDVAAAKLLVRAADRSVRLLFRKAICPNHCIPVGW
jgi:son of sevenless-like protein